MNKQDRLYYLKRVADDWEYGGPKGIEDKINFIYDICFALINDKIAELEEKNGEN